MVEHLGLVLRVDGTGSVPAIRQNVQLDLDMQGTHLTKTRSDVRGGGRKPWAQKGSGRARQGSIRSPQWRGGGVIFGPVLRSHEHKLFKKVRRLGLLCALSAKASEGRLWVLNSLAVPEGKTGTLDKSLDALLDAPQHRSVLMIDSGKTSADGGESVRRAAENLPWVDVLPQEGANVYSILQRAHLVLTAPAVDALTERLQRPITRGPRDVARRLSVARALLVREKNLSLLRSLAAPSVSSSAAA